MRLALILVPYDTAIRGWRSGAGPEHLVRAGLAAHLGRAGHQVEWSEVIEDPDAPPAEVRTAFALMRGVASAARRARDDGLLPLVLSGNCNVAAVGQLSALTPARRSVFWFDAHGEANTPDTSASGFLDGMGLSMVLGWAWTTLCASVPGFTPASPDTTFMLGTRDLDPPEAKRLKHESVAHLSVADVTGELGARLDRAPLAGTRGYLHLDLDVLDPALAGQANSIPAPGGLTTPHLLEAIRVIRARVPVAAVTLASYAPEYDRDGRVQAAAFDALAECLAGT